MGYKMSTDRYEGSSVEEMLLSDVAVKGKCRITKVSGDKGIKKRLLEMGFIKGTEIYVEKVAPLGDPMELVLKGYHLSLRRSEANGIAVQKL